MKYVLLVIGCACISFALAAVLCFIGYGHFMAGWISGVCYALMAWYYDISKNNNNQ